MAAPKLIAISGRAGSGKSTVADVLVKERGFVRVKFADALKAMLTALYETAGYSYQEIRDKLEGSLKERPCSVLGGHTPRYAMQTLGTEWGRERIAGSLWVGVWKKHVRLHLAAGHSVVTDDMRFHNELAAVQELEGACYMVVRPLPFMTAPKLHVSEMFAPNTATWIHNESSIEDLQGTARLIAST